MYEEQDMPEVELVLKVSGRDYIVEARALDIVDIGIGRYEAGGRPGLDKRRAVTEFEITSISRDGWEGIFDYVDVMEEIENNPDLSAEVLTKLGEEL